MARRGQNDFVMPEWQLLTTSGDPLHSTWTHYPHAVRPEQVFRWAAPARAYAGQIVRGVDGRFFLYAPVVEAASTNRDKFAIGVAVADAPEGPWRDAHPSGPIVSQSVPVVNKIQNIDPTVLVDSGRVFLYWGTFGKLKGVELASDMVTVRGTPIDVTTLSGFFEAAWLFKRGATYYLAYAANTAGPTSPCTEAVYYACLAYGTAPSPLGPWTYRGVFLAPVSSTTSHPGIVQYHGDWWLVYHTADAPGGVGVWCSALVKTCFAGVRGRLRDVEHAGRRGDEQVLPRVVHRRIEPARPVLPRDEQRGAVVDVAELVGRVGGDDGAGAMVRGRRPHGLAAPDMEP
jgi:hypothetical protein